MTASHPTDQEVSVVFTGPTSPRQVADPAPPAGPAGRQRAAGVATAARHLAGRNALLLGLLALVLVFEFATGRLLTPSNIRGIGLDVSVLLIVAVPAALLLISGFVDLSVGSILGLGGVTAGYLMASEGLGPGAAVALALGACLFAGAVNGTLVALLGLSPIIVTLGTSALVFGITRSITSLPMSGFPDSFRFLGSGRILEIPVQALIAVLVVVLGVVVATRTPVGRHVYAIGANREAAFLSGLRVRLVPMLLYVTVAAAACLGGLITAARLNSASPGTMGVGFEITVLTALLLGGTSFFGGRGSISGVVIGVIFLGVLQNGLALLGIPAFWQSIATGTVLVLAAVVNYLNDHSQAAAT